MTSLRFDLSLRAATLIAYLLVKMFWAAETSVNRSG